MDASNKLTLFISKKEVDCGVYLKWFNENGSWSYCKFTPFYKETLKIRSLRELNNDFFNIEKSVSRVSQTGKMTKKSLTLRTYRMDKNESHVFAQIYSSPKVYYYNNLEQQPFSLNNWREVVVTNSSVEVENTKENLKEYDVKIELPQFYSQGYAG